MTLCRRHWREQQTRTQKMSVTQEEWRLPGAEVEATEVRVQLRRLRESSSFTGSERLVDFLQFVVEQTLEDKAATLKEAVIGNAVYGRNPPYDPRIDSTVRVEARRLRRKLQEYYDGDGRHDRIRISLPIGGYVPKFVVGSPPAAVPIANNDLAKCVFGEGAGAAIVILPFRALSTSADEEKFAEGLTEEIMYGMGDQPGLRITSRSVAFQYKNSRISISELAKELGVNAVLQGTVRYESDRIRVTVELSDPEGFVVFADRIDAPKGEPLSVQEQISLTIVSRVRFDTSQIRSKKWAPRPAALDALAKVYRARRLLDQQIPATIHQALELFTTVSQEAPDYARGYSGMADCYCDLYRLGLIDRQAAVQHAEQYVKRALEIDPESAEAHGGLATIAAWLNWDRHAAAMHFTTALDLGTNARTSRMYGVLLTIMEEHEAADLQFKEARRIEPYSCQQDIAEAVCNFQARRNYAFEEPGTPVSRSIEALIYGGLSQVMEGKPPPAEEVLAEIERVSSRVPDLAFARAEIEAWAGQRVRADQIRTEGGVRSTHYANATLAASIGALDATISELTAAFEARELSSVWIRTDRRFDGIRHTGKFKELLERLPPKTEV